MHNIEEKLIKEMELDNHQKIKILDISKKISIDGYLVAMVARMNVAVEQKLFSDNDLSLNDFDNIRKKLGTHVLFEYTNQRNFIMAKNKDEILQEIVDTFIDNMIEYLSKESFPKKLVLKRYRE
ncbi:MAG: hypothetical protein HQK62_03195 [Desulfamplus sp.]|nr:hypothetical protein [Desulfamplus sp.]